jgi:hypothetical protein
MSTCRWLVRPRYLSRLFLSSALVGAALMVADDTVQAQSATRSRTRNNEFRATVQNPCNGDVVALQGRQVTEVRSEERATGTRFEFRDHQQAKGFAPAPTEANPNPVPERDYQYQALTRNQFRSSARSFEVRFRNRERIVCQSNCPPEPALGDDFFARVENRCKGSNGDAVCAVVKMENEAECK